ncbi:hypothetical protein BG003_002547 [Podila horticola]|nr:hypothetical protein BG003_002547 [Podila horticola]
MSWPNCCLVFDKVVLKVQYGSAQPLALQANNPVICITSPEESRSPEFTLQGAMHEFDLTTFLTNYAQELVKLVTDWIHEDKKVTAEIHGGDQQDRRD